MRTVAFDFCALAALHVVRCRLLLTAGVTIEHSNSFTGVLSPHRISVHPPPLFPHPLGLSSMASMCTIQGVVGVSKGHPFEYAEKKTYWSHDAFIALPDNDNDFALNVLTFGRDPLPLYDGIYIISGRVVLARSALSSESDVAPVLQVFVNDVSLRTIYSSVQVAHQPFYVGTNRAQRRCARSSHVCCYREGVSSPT